MLHTDLKVKHQTYVTNTHTIKKNTRWPAVRNYNGTRTHIHTSDMQMYILLAKSKCRICSTSNATYVHLMQSVTLNLFRYRD